MENSRAEYYREYRRRKREAAPVESAVTDTSLHTGVQQLRNEIQQLRNDLQHVAQQIAQQNATIIEKLSALTDAILELKDEVRVAQQTQQNVAQHVEEVKKPKRKGSSPPSSPPSLSPQTPLYSPPLLSPQSPKEKAGEDFAISSGEEPAADFPDDPDAPLLLAGRGQQRDLATFSDLQESARYIWEETQSESLQNAFYDWIEYKQERGPKEFYTRKGLIAEGKHFVRRHFEEFNVVAAVERAIAANWQGWDHK